MKKLGVVVVALLLPLLISCSKKQSSNLSGLAPLSRKTEISGAQASCDNSHVVTESGGKTALLSSTFDIPQGETTLRFDITDQPGQDCLTFFESLNGTSCNPAPNTFTSLIIEFSPSYYQEDFGSETATPAKIKRCYAVYANLPPEI
jgi:hypothetical protein